MADFALEAHGISVAEIHRNATPSFLYEAALRFEKGSAISSTGSLIAYSGKKTGRSPSDKRVEDDPEVKDDVWWGSVNIKLDAQSFKPGKGGCAHNNRLNTIAWSDARDKLAVDALALELDSLQDLFYADRRFKLLVVLQGTDTSGKDGTIRNVLLNLNPQGVRVESFKVPTEDRKMS